LGRRAGRIEHAAVSQAEPQTAPETMLVQVNMYHVLCLESVELLRRCGLRGFRSPKLMESLLHDRGYGGVMDRDGGTSANRS
jgi:hypothetical protein